MTFGIDEEFCEVPRNYLSLSLRCIVKRAVAPKVAVNGMSFGPVHFDLGEHGELSTVGTLSELFDLCFSSWLLAAKLVAGEGENFESAPF